MRPETRRLIIERTTTWSETWGLTLGFAVTQSVEKSERIVADAIVALIASAVENEKTQLGEARTAKFTRDFAAEVTNDTPSAAAPAPFINSITATRFATVLWGMANAQAYRSFGADSFFRMPAIARAIVILKTKARFSRAQISEIVDVSVQQIDNHLENARLLFSDGRPWVETSPELVAQGDGWAPECPQWNASAPQSGIADVFVHYIDNDLDQETGQKLHSHLLVCTTCRSSFAHFKKQYLDWSLSIPLIEPAPEMRKHIEKVTKMALKVNRRQVGDAPKALIGLQRALRDNQIRAMVVAATAVMVLQFLLHHHHYVP